MIKRWFPWLIKGGVSVGLTVWVLAKIDLAAAWEQAKDIDPLLLIASCVLMLIQTGLGAVRWGMVLRALAAPLRWGQTLALYYIGIFFAIVLPGAVGGDAVRMWASRRAGMALSAAVNSVMLERAVTVLGLVLLVCMTQPVLLARVPDLPGTWVFPALLAIAVFGLSLLSQLDRIPGRWRAWRVMRGMALLAADTRSLFFSPRFGLGTLAVAVAGHVNLSLAVFCIARGLDLDVHVLDCLVLVPPVILIITMPISIAGWGVRETAMVSAFAYIGVADESAVVVSILYGLVTMVTALPGGVVFLLSGFHRGQTQGGKEDGLEDSAAAPGAKSGG